MTDLSHFRTHWTEKRPQPLEMTDSEILDWLDEYLNYLLQAPANEEFPRRFILDITDGPTARGSTLRETVCLAAAKFKAANE